MRSPIGMPPLAKYREGVFGTAQRPGVGLPARITDEQRLRLDFTPYVERTIQDYGVVIDEIHYYHDVLRRWIGAKDGSSKRKRKFLFRRDPRDQLGAEGFREAPGAAEHERPCQGWEIQFQRRTQHTLRIDPHLAHAAA